MDVGNDNILFSESHTHYGMSCLTDDCNDGFKEVENSCYNIETKVSYENCEVVPHDANKLNKLRWEKLVP